MKKVDLSIIILHYNTPDLLENCINSVLKHTSKISYEIIIVDNASSKGISTLNKLAKLAKVRAIRNKDNLGFSLGNNVGIEESKGRYILLLNSDTIITSSVLEETVDWIDKHKKVGVLSCALRNADLSLQSTGGFFPTLPRIFSWMFFIDDIPFLVSQPYHLRPGKKLREVDWLTGAFFMIRREVVEEVGILDPSYFMYVEDMDFCYRIKNAGWKIVYNPSQSIIHLGGASSTKEFPLISELRGILKFYKKHKPAWQYPIALLLFKLGALARVVILGILKGSGVAKIYAKVFQSL